MPLNFDLTEELIKWKTEYGIETTAKSGRLYNKIPTAERKYAMVKLLEHLKDLGAERDHILGTAKEAIIISCIPKKQTRGLSKGKWAQYFSCAAEDLNEAKVKVFGTQSDDIKSGKKTNVIKDEKTELELEVQKIADSVENVSVENETPKPAESAPEFKEFDQSSVEEKPIGNWTESDEDWLSRIKEDK